VSDIIVAAQARFGEPFSRVVAISNIWLNGEPVPPDTPVNDDDEVAVIPPVSGG
jgi:molybdopterin converting factor small subunit